MRAFILITVDTGSLIEVLRHLRTVEGIVEAHMTFGPYDVVAILELEDVSAIGRVLAGSIQPIPGIVETLTCLAVEE